ncbi:MAG: hypothetical protein UX80_C0032G0015 [Candidatus Amesbacteria bacterium GW2011_GWA2_47_11b]|uniref:Uncharacterized protein n=1 Tax=Candidatus Amesbacteria bacterium GW2011_GWA2_47_11b TaxID=1618358 RepID=A0A0G1TRF1_9BACT|nr:MAG: hypothetical protein UX80_C0032G0015 [Candidatus Amesbacteria bacterium GW2011_GWA2_47_11b]
MVSKVLSGVEGRSRTMTNNQKIGVALVLSVVGWALWATGKYWLADIHYAGGQKNYQFFQKTQDTQYLTSSFQSFQSAVKLNSTEPAILSEYAVSMAYIAVILAPQDATSAGLLANSAATLADKAVSLSPHHPNYYKSAARVYILLSDLPSAAKVLTQAAQVSPTDPRLPYNLGLIYESLGQSDLARKAYERSLSLKPDLQDAQAALQKLAP